MPSSMPRAADTTILYTRQHGVEENLFLAPGEGDAVAVTTAMAGPAKNGDVEAGRRFARAARRNALTRI